MKLTINQEHYSGLTEARATIEENIEKVLNNELTTKKAIENIAKTINTALDKYNKANR